MITGWLCFVCAEIIPLRAKHWILALSDEREKRAHLDCLRITTVKEGHDG